MTIRQTLAGLGTALALTATSLAPSTALANQTGNASNIPAVIQGYVMLPTTGKTMQRPYDRTAGPALKHCTAAGEDQGIRNPEYVQCFN